MKPAMTLQVLKKLIAQAPRKPGVYIFRDKARKPLYIGKANNLKSRVSAYLPRGKAGPKSLAGRAPDMRIRRMIEVATKLEFQETGSDIEALILESQLIKQHLPQFNIVMRDDKQYFSVAFTDEEFPRIFLTHQPHKETRNKRQETNESGSRGRLSPVSYAIGPFTDGTALKSTLRILRRLFPYCTCKQYHRVRCLNAHIGKCLGFCCLKELNKETRDKKQETRKYHENIKAISEILNGKRASLIKQMEKEMDALAKKGDLEEAIVLRGKIEHLKRVFENAQVISGSLARSSSAAIESLAKDLKLGLPPQRIEGYDISNIQGIHATGSMVVFTDGQANKNDYRLFKIKTIKGSDLPRQGSGKAGDTAMLKEVLTRRLNHPEWPAPQLILIDGGKGQLNAARFVVPRSIPIIALTKDERHQGNHIYINTTKRMMYLRDLSPASRNLILSVDAEAHRFAINYYRKLHRRKLTRTP